MDHESAGKHVPHHLKIASDGAIFLDHRSLSLSDLPGRLTEIQRQDGLIVYHRERPLSPDAPTNVKEVFQLMTDLKLPIALGNDAPLEWGEIASLMIYRGPNRFALVCSTESKQVSMLFVPEKGSEEPISVRAGLNENDHIFRSIATLVSADRVIETPMVEPQKLLDDESKTIDCLYVMIAFTDGRSWASYYIGGAAPSNVDAFAEDCRALIIRDFPKIGEINQGNFPNN